MWDECHLPVALHLSTANMVVKTLGFSGAEVQCLITRSVCVERQLWWEGKWLQLPGPWITELAVSFEVTQPKSHLLKSHVSEYVRGSSSLGKRVVWCWLGVVSVSYSSSLSDTYISTQFPALYIFKLFFLQTNYAWFRQGATEVVFPAAVLLFFSTYSVWPCWASLYNGEQEKEGRLSVGLLIKKWFLKN